jgi:phospholipid/cholesterol/gamma-HCH transport system substrate-binding protein
MDRNTLNLWVGLFVVAGFAAFLMLALRVGNLGSADLTNAYTLKAHFDNIGGLKERAPVRSAGVVVGRVTGIRFDPRRYDAEVSMAIDQRYPFPKDTTVSILTSGLLGEQYIGLEAGGDTAMLKDGDTVKLTQSALVLERLIGQFLFGKAQESKEGAANKAQENKESSGNKK